MPRDEGIDVRKPARKPAAKPAYNAPAWKNKPARKQKDDEAGNDPQPTTRGPQYVPPGLSQRPTTAAQFTPPAWLTNAKNAVSKWMDENISGSQYVPAGLSQPQRPTTAAQFKPPIWGGNPMQVSEPYSPSLPTGTFFSGGSIADGTRLVRTGENTSLLLGGGGIRNKGTVRIAKGGGVSPVTTPTTTTDSAGWGTTYKKKGSGGGSYSANTYSSDRAPSWLMNLYNWNFKG